MEHEILDFSYKGPNLAWDEYDDEEDWTRGFLDDLRPGRHENAFHDEVESLKDRPVEVIPPQGLISEVTSGNPPNHSQVEVLGLPVSGSITENSAPTERLSKGQRQRKNRRLAKSLAISGLISPGIPVSVPLPSIPQVSSTPPPPTQTWSTLQSMSCSLREAIQEPVSLRDYLRLKFLVACIEEKNTPIRTDGQSRKKSDWRQLWIQSPWTQPQGSQCTNSDLLTLLSLEAKDVSSYAW